MQGVGGNETCAVKCHDWMKLSDDQYPEAPWTPIPPTRWAIVKDYLPKPVQLSDVSEIVFKKDITLRANICPFDVQSRNFRGSFMVDLRAAKTCPYFRQLLRGAERLGTARLGSVSGN